MFKEFTCMEEVEDKEKIRKMKHWRVMENTPELSLDPSGFVDNETADRYPLFSAGNRCRKRKFPWEHMKSDPLVESGFELQLKDPLPIDWEQCLDLDSGTVYYVNRNTFKKSCCCPKDQKLDLDLSISTTMSINSNGESPKLLEDQRKHSNPGTNMVAVACLKCHLLVMLHKSSPFCPNCKYLHSFPTRQNQLQNTETTKSLKTLRLLN